MFKLVIEDDDGNRTVVPVIRDEISIGRRQGSTIRLNERNVSRDHAKLIRENESVFIEDQGSRYHTFCNSSPIEGRVRFSIGDVFNIGDYVLSLQSDAVDAADSSGRVTQSLAPPSELGPKDGTEIIMTVPGRLVVTSSNFAGQGFALTKKEMILGRGEDCDIIIDHRSVSTRHAKVVRGASGSYQIVDLNSKNGIKINGEDYKSTRLKRGDSIEMGHVHFRFVEPGENYVFSPQASLDFDDDEIKTGTKWLLPVLGLVVIAALASAFLLFGRTDPPKTSSESFEVAKNDSVTISGIKSAEKLDKKVDSNLNYANIDTIIENAQQSIKAGEIDKAIAKLETAKLLKPDSGRVTKIDSLLADAAIWSSLAKSLDMGRDNFKAKRYGQALEKFRKISVDRSTPIYKIMMKDRLPQKSIAALLKQTKRLTKKGKKEEAQEALNAILLYDSENSSALALKKNIKPSIEIASLNNEATAFKKKEIALRKARKAKKLKKEKSTFEKDPAKGKELCKLALKKFFNEKNYSTGIRLAKEAVKNGHYRCNHSLGNFYEVKKDKKNACRYYKKARAEQKLEKLSCD